MRRSLKRETAKFFALVFPHAFVPQLALSKVHGQCPLRVISDRSGQFCLLLDIRFASKRGQRSRRLAKSALCHKRSLSRSIRSPRRQAIQDRGGVFPRLRLTCARENLLLHLLQQIALPFHFAAF